MAVLTWFPKAKATGTFETYEAELIVGPRTFKADIKHVFAYGGNWHGRLRVIVDDKTILTRRSYRAMNPLKAKAMVAAAIDELLAEEGKLHSDLAGRRMTVTRPDWTA